MIRNNNHNNRPPHYAREAQDLKNPVDSNMHPPFLHNNDHLGLSLVSQKLTGRENYSMWSRFLEISLFAKHKFVLMSGEYPEPPRTSN